MPLFAFRVGLVMLDFLLPLFHPDVIIMLDFLIPLFHPDIIVMLNFLIPLV